MYTKTSYKWPEIPILTDNLFLAGDIGLPYQDNYLCTINYFEFLIIFKRIPREIIQTIP